MNKTMKNFQAAKAVAKILGGIFASAAASCLWEAAENCKSQWKNPGKAISCGVSIFYKFHLYP